MKSGPMHVGAVVVLLMTAGCGSSGSKSGSKTYGATTPIEAAPVETAPAASAPSEESDLPGSVPEINRKGYLQDVFFDFGSSTLRSDQRDRLAANAEWLKKWPSVKIRIEGHCDERGTAQYNLALGDQRAESVREYLRSIGVDPSRVEVISLGKERPFVRGHDEAAFAQNRRDHFVVIQR